MNDILSIWTVVEKPSDLDCAFSARRWEIGAGGTSTATDDVLTANSLAELRQLLPWGLYRLDRFADDDPAIVETWI